MRPSRPTVVAFIVASLCVSSAHSGPSVDGKVTVDRGVSRSEFNVAEGVVAVTVPEKLQAGDTFSGTVRLYPSGEGRKQAANLRSLTKKYHVRWNDSLATAGEGIVVGRVLCKNGLLSLGSKSDASYDQTCGDQSEVELKLGKGKKVLKILALPIVSTGIIAVERFSHEMFGQPGRVMRIKGPFDGNLRSTDISDWWAAG